MNASVNVGGRKQLWWLVAGVVLGVLIACNPYYAPAVSDGFCAVAWCVDMLFVLALSASANGVRVGCVVAGGFLAVPCFIPSPPLARGVWMCVFFLPLCVGAFLIQYQPIQGFRSRLAFICSTGGYLQVKREPARLNVAALMRLLAATLVLAGALDMVIAGSANHWRLLRWFGGGVAALAFAEMGTAAFPLVGSSCGVAVLSIMRSPFLSLSLAEFWSERWNVLTSKKVFRPYFFDPLARHGAAFALWVVFIASGVVHALLAYMTLGRLEISMICGLFFVLQAPLILLERGVGERKWPAAARRVWALTLLAITSPLFLEPALQAICPDWAALDSAIGPTLASLGFLLGFAAVVSVASRVSTTTRSQTSRPS